MSSRKFRGRQNLRHDQPKNLLFPGRTHITGASDGAAGQFQRHNDIAINKRKIESWGFRSNWKAPFSDLFIGVPDGRRSAEGAYRSLELLCRARREAS